MRNTLVEKITQLHWLCRQQLLELCAIRVHYYICMGTWDKLA